MNKPPIPSYCWDTSVLLASINEDKPRYQGDIDVILGQVYKKKAILLISVITYTEILQARHTDEQRQWLDKFLHRSNVVMADTTFPIARKAEQIRSSCLVETPPRKIRTPDATIVATAILHEASVLHTFDNQLLNLDGHQVLDGLRIYPPRDLGGRRSLL